MNWSNTYTNAKYKVLWVKASAKCKKLYCLICVYFYEGIVESWDKADAYMKPTVIKANMKSRDLWKSNLYSLPLGLPAIPD